MTPNTVASQIAIRNIRQPDCHQEHIVYYRLLGSFDAGLSLGFGARAAEWREGSRGSRDSARPHCPRFLCRNLRRDCRGSQAQSRCVFAREPFGVPHEAVLSHGDLGDCISRLIETRKIDLVIVGTKGAMGLTKVLLGSGAEEIFREASCPVMTIGPEVGASARSEFKDILFAMELKPASMLAYLHARGVAVQNNARLTVLHVVPLANAESQDRGMPEYRQYVRSLVSGALSKASPNERCPLCPTVMVECGAAPEVILRVARQLPSDLIVMSVHHARRFAIHLPWAVAHEVVAHAPCPVLTIRA